MPSVLIFSFLAIFLQWGFAGYLLTSITFALASMPALLLRFASPRVRLVAPVVLVLGGTAMTIARLPILLRRVCERGNVPRVAGSSRLAASKQHVYMSCIEGAGALAYYAERFHGLRLELSSDPATIKDPATLLLADRKLCLMPAGEWDGRFQTLVWSGPQSNSLRLLR